MCVSCPATEGGASERGDEIKWNKMKIENCNTNETIYNQVIGPLNTVKLLSTARRID